MSTKPNTDVEAANETSWRPRLALLVAATFFMEFLDGTILTTAIPSIASDFRVAPADINITMTAYLVTVAMGIPLSSWLAERFGARRIFCLAISIFTIASLLCAISTDLTMLTLSRVAQGMGGAMMVPVGTLVVLRGTPKSELLRATAYLVWPGLLAPVLAPMVGGALTTFLSWHWIFIINVPLGLAAFIAALRLVPRTQFDAKRRLDWFGLLLTTLGVGALVVGLETLGGHASNVLAVVVVAAGVLSLAGAVWWMRKASVPLFNLSVFGTRTFRATSTGGFIYRLTISSVPFLLPLMFQDGFGWDPLKAGVMVAAVFVGNIGIKPATTPLIRRFGFKPVLVFASFASAVTFALCAFLDAQTPEPLIFALLLLSGAFRSIGFSAYASVQYADIVPGQLPSANAISATLVQLAAAAGIAVGALFLRLFETTQVFGGEHVAAYKGAFVAMAILMLISTVDSLTLHRHAGAEVSGGAKRG
ncbi:MFS transporter [Arthrobacter sp. Rue61a]|jgi:EmrB/QacA subfamily drug resistance transporter|uniref:Transmembrane efflux protein (MFS) n=1 Tax=Paenarthrobacter aurescens (strain TC1) TaxID=290340 RepID=A1R323_PAEAT|nr:MULTISPECIES: MFS transporter [Micrococcaceae]ABM10134.1 putative transmembrane efflux protein (MFS) [Paenarthrobacter aurescens TC1]AFR27720.1 putative transport protein HsrA [Arthrobacter sp. Rue61a]